MPLPVIKHVNYFHFAVISIAHSQKIYYFWFELWIEHFRSQIFYNNILKH